MSKYLYFHCTHCIYPVTVSLFMKHFWISHNHNQSGRLHRFQCVTDKSQIKDTCLCFQEVLDIARLLLVELGQHNDCEIEEKKSKLEQLKTVLEMWVKHPPSNTQHQWSSSCFLPSSSSSFISRHPLHQGSGISSHTHRHMFTLIHSLPLESLTLCFISSSLLCVSSLLPTHPSFFLYKRESSLNDTQYAPSHFKGWGFTTLLFFSLLRLCVHNIRNTL